MNKNKYVVIVFIIVLIFGAILGIIEANYYNSIVQENELLKQENQMLQDMLFNQQDPYRPDTTQEPKEVEGCEL